MPLSKSHAEPSWLSDARRDALESYRKLEPPKYRRTDLSGVDVEALARRAADAAQPARTYAKAEGLLHIPLAQAAREHADLVRPFLASAVAASDKWSRLRHALWSEGDLLFVEKGVALDEPIRIDLRHAAQGRCARDLIVVERGAKASIVARATGSGRDALSLETAEVDLRDNASLALATLQDLHHGARLLSGRRVKLHRDARLSWVDGQLGAGTVVAENETLLEGPGSTFNYIGAFFGSGGQHFDITTSALHTGPHTASKLDMKGALSDDGYSVNYSIVNIGPAAKSASGHQHQETLLLSDKSRADAIPKLDVENNDVSASHGATVGQVDAEQVFYLRSRGFTENAAKRLIVEGFFEPLMREIPLDDVRDELRATIASRMRG